MRGLRSLVAVALLLAPAAAGASRPKIDAWPFLELDDDTTTVLYPLFSKEGDSVTAFPFYYRTNDGRDHHVLWPMAKVSEGRVERVAPFWFSGEESYTFFPLIHRTKESTLLLVPPSMWTHDGDFAAFLPFYARVDDDAFYAPNVFVSRETGPDGERVLSGLNVFPLFGFGRAANGPRRTLTMLLLAQTQWGGEGRESYLVPLGGLRTGSTDDFVWLLNTYRSRDVKLFAPLYYQRSKPDDRERWVLSWREKRSPARDVSAVYPFYATTSERLDDGRLGRKQSVLWPIYRRDEVRSSEGRRESRTRRFLFFKDETQADGSRRFSILGWPVSETIEQETRAPEAPL